MLRVNDAKTRGETMTTATARPIYLTMTCKPFSDQPRSNYTLLVEIDGTVRVYDCLAGYYTTCHSLSEKSQQAARRKARRAASEKE